MNPLGSLTIRTVNVDNYSQCRHHNQCWNTQPENPFPKQVVKYSLELDHQLIVFRVVLSPKEIDLESEALKIIPSEVGVFDQHCRLLFNVDFQAVFLVLRSIVVVH